MHPMGFDFDHVLATLSVWNILAGLAFVVSKNPNSESRLLTLPVLGLLLLLDYLHTLLPPVESVPGPEVGSHLSSGASSLGY